MAESPNDARGLMKVARNQDRLLILDPPTAVFPMRCIFTNEPVEGLTELTLHQVKIESVAPRITGARESQRVYGLPVSPAWVRQRGRAMALIRRAILIVAGLSLVVAIVAACLPSSMVSERAKPAVGGICLGLAIMGIVIWVAWPLLKDLHTDCKTIRAEFAEPSDPQDWIIIPGVHPDFLAPLPDASLLFGRP